MKPSHSSALAQDEHFPRRLGTGSAKKMRQNEDLECCSDSAGSESALGFTVVEMLVAVALLALITAAITGGLGFGRGLWVRDRAYERRAELEAAVQGIAAMIATAYPATAAAGNTGPATASAGRPRIAFEGRPATIRFVGLSEGRGQVGGLIETVIAMADEGGSEGGKDGRMWERRWEQRRPNRQRISFWTTPFRNLQSVSHPLTGMHATVVTTRSAALRFSYLGADENPQGGQRETTSTPVDQPRWTPEWVGRDRLPMAVSVTLVDATERRHDGATAETGEITHEVRVTVGLRQR